MTITLPTAFQDMKQYNPEFIGEISPEQLRDITGENKGDEIPESNVNAN